MNKLIIIGAGGFGRETAWLVERINEKEKTWQIMGFLDDDSSQAGKVIDSYPVLGKISDFGKFDDAYFICAIASTQARKSIVKKLEGSVRFPVIIDPAAIVSPRAKIKEGSIICAGSIVSVGTEIGAHNIIDVNSTVGHDAQLMDFVTLYPAVNVSGWARLCEGAQAGTGSQILQNVIIGEFSFLGASALANKDIPPFATAVGVPAKVIKQSKKA